MTVVVASNLKSVDAAPHSFRLCAQINCGTSNTLSDPSCLSHCLELALI